MSLSTTKASASWSRRAIGVAAVLSTLSLLAVAAAPASSAASANVSLSGVSSNGTVGVPQNLTVTAAISGSPCGSVLAPSASILGTISGTSQTLGSATFTRCVGSSYQYSFRWLPTSAVTVDVFASVADGTSSSSRSNVSAVSTTTRIEVASVVRIGVPAVLTASVTANSGSLASPQGTIQFSVVGGGPIGGPVALDSAVPSTVQIQWTPAVLGQVSIIATYTPATINGVVNTTCGRSCSSAADTTQVTDSGVLVYLADPPGFAVGLPSVLTAVVSAVPANGVVTFTVNGAPIAVNLPVPATGTVTTMWVPPAPGQYTVAAFWTSATGARSSASEVVTATAEPAQADVLSLAPQGQPAWTTTGVYSLRNGTSTTFTVTAASGMPTTLTVSGPCTLVGATLTINQGTGSCRLTAASGGGNGFGPAQAVYQVSLALGNQTPRATVRASGDIKRGTTFTLATRANNVTNAGQRMTWSITSGGSRCQLRYPSNGNVQLRAVKNGSCGVRATAPAVSRQWNRMTLNRTYRVR